MLGQTRCALQRCSPRWAEPHSPGLQGSGLRVWGVLPPSAGSGGQARAGLAPVGEVSTGKTHLDKINLSKHCECTRSCPTPCTGSAPGLRPGFPITETAPVFHLQTGLTPPSSPGKAGETQGENVQCWSHSIPCHPKVSGVCKWLQGKLSPRSVPSPAGELFVGLGYI